MRSIKLLVLATASLLFFDSYSFAEMTAMSFQERIKQSDLIVVAEIFESHNTGVV